MKEKNRKQRRSLTFRQNDNVIDLDHAREARREKRTALKELREEKFRVREATKKQRAKKRRKLMVYLGFFSVAVIFIGLSAWNLVSVNVQYKDVLSENETLKQQKAELEEELSNTSDPDYIEQQARSQLKMIRPGERLYVFPKDESVSDAAEDENPLTKDSEDGNAE